MKTNYILTIIGAIIMLIVSCERVDESITNTKKDVVGEWQVAAYIDNEPVSDIFMLNVSMSETAKSDSIIIKDLAEESIFWDFSVDAAYLDQKGAFETELSQCMVSEDENVGVNITNGKVIGSDSIYFEIKFEDDEVPFGTIYEIKGRRLKS